MGGLTREYSIRTPQVRRSGKPAALVYSNLARRFGHAGTDRQAAYLTADEIEQAAYTNPLEGACAAAVAEGIVGYDELAFEFETISAMTEAAFEKAAQVRFGTIHAFASWNGWACTSLEWMGMYRQTELETNVNVQLSTRSNKALI